MKKMHFFAFMVLLFTAVACSDSKPDYYIPTKAPVLTLTSEDTFSFTQEGGSGEITYTLTHPKEGAKLQADCEADWVSDLIAGEKISFTVKENTEKKERSTSIRVSYPKAEGFEVKIHQEGNLQVLAQEEDPASLPLISSNPAIFTDATTDGVIVRVNVAGTAFEGKFEEFYAHTGVITDKSTGLGDWKYVKTDWGENSEETKLVRYQQSNIFYLVFPQGPRAYYGVPEGEKIQQLAFVFRSADSKSELKDNGNDIFLNLSEEGLNALFTSPSTGAIWEIGRSYTVTVQFSEATYGKLFCNGELVAESNGEAIRYNYTPQQPEDLLFKAEAGDGTEVVTSEIQVVVLGQTEEQPRPANAREGVTLNGSEATFVLYAPGKESVSLLGDFNDFLISNKYLMKRDGDYFWTTISGLNADTEYAYQFLVDGSIRVGDPYGTKVLDPWNDQWIPESTYPNLKAYPANASEMVCTFTTSTSTPYDWAPFERPKKNALAIYELHFRDFSSTSDIDGALEHLDYLDQLGINAIELMPIMEFDGNDSWGYNPCFYFAPDKAYGTVEDYKHFINECHKRGIAVIVDVVFNHATGQFPWAKMWWDSSKNCTSSENPFFNVEAVHNWSVYHDFNHTYDKTRSYFKEVLQYWLREYNIDGYRFDLTKGIVQHPGNYDASGYSAERIGFLKEYADAIREVSDNAYIIFEHFCDNSEENELAAYKDILLWSNNGMGAYGESVMGWTGNGKSDFSGAFRAGRVNNIETHDEERIGYKAITYGASWMKNDWSRISEQIQSAYAFHFLSPYPKMMWQFGELAYDYTIEYNGRTGRKPVKWDYYEDPARRAIYDTLSKVISFRTEHEAMYADGVTVDEFTYRVGDSYMSSKYLIYRTSAGSVVVIANFSNTDATAQTIPVGENGTWTNLLTNEPVEITDGKYTVSPAVGELIVLVKRD